MTFSSATTRARPGCYRPSRGCLAAATPAGARIFAFNTSVSCALAGTLHLQAGVLDPDPHLHDGVPSRLSLSSVTHLGDANTSANVIMAKTGHKSLRSVQRYVKPGLAAVHQATEALSSPRRRG